MRETVRRVVFEQVMFDEKDFVKLKCGQFIGERADAFADDHAEQASAPVCCGDLLRGGERFKAGLVPFAVALFGDEENIHRVRTCSPDSTRASCFSFSISFAAISFGVPVRNSVFLVFCGT